VRRSFTGHPDVLQIVLSDGLAAVSIFIEPLREGQSMQETTAAKGALHVVGKRLGGDWVTTLGEAPLATVRQFADSVQAVSVSQSQP
jgi:sigma-E factor negative regulatory protein RseB